jgi:hypothetical protein
MRDRVDRYRALERELGGLGIPMSDPKVRIPVAPVVQDADGFPSRGVRGNFLSHLGAIESTAEEGIETLLVLEDDAIFRRTMRSPALQRRLCEQLASGTWDLCFLGHPLSHSLAGHEEGLVLTDVTFKWSHCYLVHRRVARRLGDYLRATMSRPPGDPAGGKMYIDGAVSLWRTLNPDVLTLVANPALSIQKGSPSGLAGKAWYEGWAPTRIAAHAARAMRDQLWRHTGWPAPSEK